MIWPEIEEARKRYELTLTGDRILQRLEDEKGVLDPALFSLCQLNHLEISSLHLKEIDGAGLLRLVNLQSLNLRNNELSCLPDSLEPLQKLKHLDLSCNQLVQLPSLLPPSLETLTAANNQLEEVYLHCALDSLTTIDLSHCKLRTLVIDNAPLLRIVDLKENAFTSLPECLADLPSLKTLDVSTNQLEEFSAETIVRCVRLRELTGHGNPIKDNRLRKLLDQKAKTRAIVEFLASRVAKKPPPAPQTKHAEGTQEAQDEVNGVIDDSTVQIVPASFSVLMNQEARESGYHLTCCVLKGVDLSDQKLDKLIREQIRLHDEVFNKRFDATLATHDLSAIAPGDLAFSVAPVDQVSIAPLGHANEISGEAIFEKLRTEAERRRKQKKRDRLLALHRYLEIVIVRGKVAFLQDSKRTLSMHPLTNCEQSKLHATTRDVLLEVCSAVSLDKARQAMEASVDAFIRLGCWPSDGNNSHMQQVKVLNEKDRTLKYVYPSRIDLVDQKLRFVFPRSK